MFVTYGVVYFIVGLLVYNTLGRLYPDEEVFFMYAVFWLPCAIIALFIIGVALIILAIEYMNKGLNLIIDSCISVISKKKD